MLAATARMTAQSLLAHKLRAALSMLGTAIGIAGVLALATIGNGSSEQVRKQLELLGPDLLTVQPSQSTRGGKGARIAARPFDIADAEAIWRHVSGLRYVVPVASSPMLSIARKSSWTSSVTGTTSEYFAARRWQLAQGRSFSDYEMEIGKSVCVLGATVHAQLFGGEPAVGQSVRVKSVPCEVIGVLQPRGQTGATMDDDNIIAMPLLGFQRRLLGKADVHTILVLGLPDVSTQRMEARLESLLRERRAVRGGDEDFAIANMKQVATAMLETSRTMTGLLTAVAYLSLLVGAIGIMNVMLISVQERTREIGVRLAIGATPRDVRRQFLLEAVLIGLAGALLGIVAGLAAGMLGAHLLGLPIVIGSATVVWAIVVSVLIGLASGYLPAGRAARLDPIEALRQG